MLLGIAIGIIIGQPPILFPVAFMIAWPFYVLRQKLRG